MYIDAKNKRCVKNRICAYVKKPPLKDGEQRKKKRVNEMTCRKSYGRPGSNSDECTKYDPNERCRLIKTKSTVAKDVENNDDEDADIDVNKDAANEAENMGAAVNEGLSDLLGDGDGDGDDDDDDDDDAVVKVKGGRKIQKTRVRAKRQKPKYHTKKRTRTHARHSSVRRKIHR